MEKISFHEEPNSKVEVHKILTLDWLHRKDRHWPLLPITKDTSKLFTYTKKELPDEDYVFMISDRQRSLRYDISTELHLQYPQLSLFLNKYKGKLAVCGGALTRILYSQPVSDLDIFFYNCTEDEAAIILKDCLSILAVSCAGMAGMARNARIEKKDNIVNFITDSSNNHGNADKLCYQFILRIYPSLDTIIGGFDLGSCMLAFDGENTYATYLGAWSIYKGCNIVDTTRRSLSFDRRLVKYADMGFGIVMPGLPLKLTKDVTPKEEIAKYNALRTFLKQNNMCINTDSFRGEYNGLRNVIEIKSKRVEIEDVVVTEYSIRKKNNEFLSRLTSISEKMLKQHSDYEYYYYNDLEKTTGTMLRCNNLSGVIAYLKIDEGTKCEQDEIDKFLDNPRITIPDVKTFQEYLVDYGLKHKKMLNEHRNTKKEISLFAEYVLEYRKKCKTCCKKKKKEAKIRSTSELLSFLEKTSLILHQRMVDNAFTCEENLKGLKFITKNPGRQWTSSINPVMENPRQYYKEHYVPFTVGLDPSVETTLRCMRKCGSVWSMLPKDIFHLILRFTIEMSL